MSLGFCYCGFIMLVLRSKRLELLGIPAFRWFVMSCVLATFGGGLGYVAMTWLLLQSDNSVGAVAILMCCFWGPNILLGPFAGVIADRYSRKWITVISNGMRAILLIGFSPYLIGEHAALLIYILTFVMGLFFSLYFPAAQALLREIVPEQDLLYANSVLDIAYEVGNVVGMGSAGFFVAWFSVSTAVLCNGIIFFMSALAMARVKGRIVRVLDHSMKAAFFQDFLAGLRYLAERPGLLVVYTMQLMLMVSFMTAPILLAPFSKNILHASVEAFGSIGISLSVGIIIGGLVVPSVAERIGFLSSLTVMFVLLAVGFLLFGMNRHIPTAMLLYGMVGFALSAWPVIVTQAQEMTDLSFQGRVQSFFNSMGGVIILGVYLLVDFSSHYIPLQSLYGFEVLFSLIALCILWRYRKLLGIKKRPGIAGSV